MKDKNSLAHTAWNCKYHIVFAPKYRRQDIYGKIRVDIGKMLRMLCDRKGIEIIEAELCKDHIHMLVQIPPKYSVSDIVGYLKVILSILVDTFLSRISLTMLPAPNLHNTSCVLS